MTWTPTDEQVEKHARVGYDFDEEHRVLFGYQTEPLPFESLPQWAQDTHREKARAQLVAVGPHIAASAWREGWGSGYVDRHRERVGDDGHVIRNEPTPNPYREKEAGR